VRDLLWLALRTINLSLLVLLFGTTGVLLGSYAGIAKVVPDVRALGEIQPGSGSRIISADGEVLATLAAENRQYVSLDRIPKHLQEAAVAVEDRGFYQHVGVDPRGIMRAVYRDVLAGGARQGGSTITQQLARNVYLTRKRTITRKLAEMVLAVQLERAYTKPEILEFYLNQIYFGEGAYGVQVAAKTYFRKEVSKLSLAECALLTGLIRAPEYYSPFEDEQRSQDRRDRVLSMMQDEGYLTSAEAAGAKTEPLKLSPVRKPLARGKYTSPWFVTYVIKQFSEQYSPEALYQGQYVIHTTINMEMQRAAEEAVRKGLERRRSAKVSQMALVAVDVRTGAIKAMVGGADFAKNQYNIAAQGDGRQAGSAFKPFVYTAALLQGETPDSRVKCEHVSYPGGGGRRWTPHDYGRGYHGWLGYRRALALSCNISAVKVAEKVGIDAVIDVAEKMGIPRDKVQPYLPTAIGAASVTPLEMASAFSIFATRGMRTEPYAIEKVVDARGRVVDEHRSIAWRVLDQDTAATMVDMMTDVIQSPGGTAAGIRRLLTFPAAGKTGTSSKNRDAWFVGYSDNLCAAVWAGNLDNSPTHRQAGSTISAPVWAEFMVKAEPIMVAVRQAGETDRVEEIRPPAPQRVPEREPEPAEDQAIPPEYAEPQAAPETGQAPEGLVEKSICAESGLLASRNCPDRITVTYDLEHGDEPPDRGCDLHGRRAEPPPPPAPVRTGSREAGQSQEPVTLSVCAITKKLATPYCPVVQNVTFDPGKAPTETCPRHGRR
jgi:penicillin-binding protein 1A